VKTKLIILGLIVIILGGLGLWFKSNPKVQPISNKANTNEINDWKIYSNTELSLSFKYPSILFLTTDAPKDKYCNKSYDYIFLQNSASVINVRITTIGTFCTWGPFPVVGDKSYTQSTLNISGFQVSKFVKIGVERGIPLAYTFVYNNKVVDIFGEKTGPNDSFSESAIEQIISSFKFTK